ncbi:MAG: bifunctional methylenetetrahydrofolate dehydrogenase/methenyltetrahydrofolate cyclohydrolase FolD [Paludibacteraceae bacterium]|nr:bifunctional methylenetetrahydrofolate dehydrogenase/methenyltetrahydrofolate cyclohydrolase FolD [Paludibacteraceae bacterium]
MKILNGKEFADKIKDEVKADVEVLTSDGKSVYLAVIQVGDDAASSTYVRNKHNACVRCGITSSTYNLANDESEENLIEMIQTLNKNNYVHGILVQLPLPNHIDEHKVIQSIAPEKDVDGFHEINVGKLMVGEDTFIPCTAKGIIELLKYNDVEIEGKHCVVVGRSNIVGKPVAMELLHHNATVTMCHSKTKELEKICKEADILVCAIGKPKFFNRDYIKEGAVVVDVGIHRTENGLCGDVDFDDVKDIVSAITPVPGGVGQMTIAMLMKNCVQAAQMQLK